MLYTMESMYYKNNIFHIFIYLFKVQYPMNIEIRVQWIDAYYVL